jgi:hypothetical protein
MNADSSALVCRYSQNHSPAMPRAGGSRNQEVVTTSPNFTSDRATRIADACSRKPGAGSIEENRPAQLEKMPDRAPCLLHSRQLINQGKYAFWRRCLLSSRDCSGLRSRCRTRSFGVTATAFASVQARGSWMGRMSKYVKLRASKCSRRLP